jgi:hypothetical protein
LSRFTEKEETDEIEWHPRRIPSYRGMIPFRIIGTLVGVFFIFLGYNQFSYRQPFDGLVLASVGGIIFLMGVVYSAEWFQNLIHSFRIIQAIFFVTLVAGIISFFIYGPKEAIVAASLVGFTAEVTGTFFGLYFYIKEHTEEHKDSLPPNQTHKKRMVRS